MQPVVPVAIDVTSMEEAMSLAKSAIRAGADWLEAGTPFIQAEGMRGIRELRARNVGHRYALSDVHR